MQAMEAKHKTPKMRMHPHSWLWWVAVFIIIIGSGLAYILSLDKYNANADILMRKAIVFTVIGSGLCIISALGQWFIKR